MYWFWCFIWNSELKITSRLYHINTNLWSQIENQKLKWNRGRNLFICLFNTIPPQRVWPEERRFTPWLALPGAFDNRQACVRWTALLSRSQHSKTQIRSLHLQNTASLTRVLCQKVVLKGGDLKLPSGGRLGSRFL